MNYGLRHRYYAQPLEGWPPGQFPLGHSFSLHGLGQVDSGCAAGMPYDEHGNECTNCEKGMPYDENGNPCSTPAPVSTYAIPTGSALVYKGTWQAILKGPLGSWANASASDVIAAVTQSLPGLQVSGPVANDYSTLRSLVAIPGVPQDFNLTINLLVTGPGFSSPAVVQSMIDSNYQTATTQHVVSSSIYVQSLGSPGASGYNLPPGGAGVPCQAGYSRDASGQCVPTTMSQWIQANAWWMVLAGAAAIALPRLL